MPEPMIVVSGAPELRRVPQHFWRRLAKAIREEWSGQVSFNLNKGTPASLDAKEHVRAEDQC